MLSKFSVFTTASAGLAERVRGYRISDPHNPFVQVVCDMYSRAYKLTDELARLKRRPTTELAFKEEAGAWPYATADNDAIYAALAHDLECDVSSLLEWMVKARKAQTPADIMALPLLLDRGSEVDGKMPVTRVPYPA